MDATDSGCNHRCKYQILGYMDRCAGRVFWETQVEHEGSGGPYQRAAAATERLSTTNRWTRRKAEIASQTTRTLSITSMSIVVVDGSEGMSKCKENCNAGARQLGRGGLQEENARCTVAEAGGHRGCIRGISRGRGAAHKLRT